MDCRRPVRIRHSSPAASAAAPMVTCATVPNANEDGITGSAPVSSIASRAAAGWSTARHSVASTSFGFGAVIPGAPLAPRSLGCPTLFLHPLPAVGSQPLLRQEAALVVHLARAGD